jgi:hypothetical protein
MDNDTCQTPDCRQPASVRQMCSGCYRRSWAGRPPKPWEPRRKHAAIVPPIGDARARDLERIAEVAAAVASRRDLRTRQRAFLAYILKLAAEMGSERMEILHVPAAEAVGVYARR